MFNYKQWLSLLAISFSIAPAAAIGVSFSSATFAISEPKGLQEDGTLYLEVDMGSISFWNARVPIQVSGTATAGTDYSLSANYVYIPMGQSKGGIYITVNRDQTNSLSDPLEGPETIVLQLQPGSGYTLGNIPATTITINDVADNTPRVKDFNTNVPHALEQQPVTQPIPGALYTFRQVDGIDYEALEIAGHYDGSRRLDGPGTEPTQPFTAFMQADLHDAWGWGTHQQHMYQLSDIETQGFKATSIAFVNPIKVTGSYGSAHMEQPIPFYFDSNQSQGYGAYGVPMSSAPFNGNAYYQQSSSLVDEFLAMSTPFSLSTTPFKLPWVAAVASSSGSTDPIQGKTKYDLVFSVNSFLSATLYGYLEVENADGSTFTTPVNSVSLSGTGSKKLSFEVPGRQSPDNPITAIRPVIYQSSSMQSVLLSKLAIYRHLFSPNPFCPGSPDAYDKETFFCAGFSNNVTNGKLYIDNVLQSAPVHMGTGNSATVVPFKPTTIKSSYTYRYDFTDAYGAAQSLTGTVHSYSPITNNAPVARLNTVPTASWLQQGYLGEQFGKPKDGPGLTGYEYWSNGTVDECTFESWFRGCPDYQFPDQPGSAFQFPSNWNINNSIGSYFNSIVGPYPNCGGYDCPWLTQGLPYSTYKDAGIDLTWQLGFDKGFHKYTWEVGRFYNRREMSDSAAIAGINQVIALSELGQLIKSYPNPYESLSPTAATTLVDASLANADPNHFYGSSVTAVTLKDEPAPTYIHKMGVISRLLQSKGYNVVHTQSTAMKSSYDGREVYPTFQNRRTRATRDIVDVWEAYWLSPDPYEDDPLKPDIDSVDWLTNYPLGNPESLLNCLTQMERAKRQSLERQAADGTVRRYWNFLQGEEGFSQPDRGHMLGHREQFASEARLLQWISLACGADGNIYFGSPGLRGPVGGVYSDAAKANYFYTLASDGVTKVRVKTNFDGSGQPTGNPTPFRKYAGLMAYRANSPAEISAINSLPFANLFERDSGGNLILFKHDNDSPQNSYALVIDKNQSTGNLNSVYDTIAQFKTELDVNRTFTANGTQHTVKIRDVLLAADTIHQGKDPYTGAALPLFDTDNPSGSTRAITSVVGGSSGISNSQTDDDYAYVRWAVEQNSNVKYLFVVNRNCFASSNVQVNFNTMYFQVSSAVDLRNPSSNILASNKQYMTLNLQPGQGTIVRIESTIGRQYTFDGWYNPQGWSASGFPNEPDVSLFNYNGTVGVSVSPATGRIRLAGWTGHNALPYDEVGSNNIVRGSFYVFTSNPSSDPVNKVPNFRLRLSQDGAVMSTLLVSHASTGEGGVPHEPMYDYTNDAVRETAAGQYFKPSSSSALPSRYTVLLDPVDVPAAAGGYISPSFEAYATSNQANGNLQLTECLLSIEPRPNLNAATKIWDYNSSLADYAEVGGSKSVVQGRFNTDAVLMGGYRNDLFLGAPYDSTPASEFGSCWEDTSGNAIHIASNSIPVSVVGNAFGTVTSDSPMQRPRITPNKMYVTRFHVSSALTTSNASLPYPTLTPEQAYFMTRLQMASGVMMNEMEFNGPSSLATASSKARSIITQVLPGIGCQNPEYDSTKFGSGEDGGWYTMVTASPLDAKLRADNGGYFGTFANEPGPGIYATSRKDIDVVVLGQSAPNTLRTGPSTYMYNFTRYNRSSLRITDIQMYELPLD